MTAPEKVTPAQALKTLTEKMIEVMIARFHLELDSAEFHRCATLLRALEYLADGDLADAEDALIEWVPDA